MSSLKKVTQKGFTIVELLIVIVVIGILAALVITTFNGIQQKGRNTERTTDIKALQTQLEAYYASSGRYPTLANLNDQPGTGNWWIQDNMKGLAKEAMSDPKNTASTTLTAARTVNSYAYTVTPTTCNNTTEDCTGFTLTAVPEGGGADIVQKSQN